MLDAIGGPVPGFVSGNIYPPGRVVKHYFSAKDVFVAASAARAAAALFLRGERCAEEKKMSPREVFS